MLGLAQEQIIGVFVAIFIWRQKRGGDDVKAFIPRHRRYGRRYGRLCVQTIRFLAGANLGLRSNPMLTLLWTGYPHRSPWNGPDDAAEAIAAFPFFKNVGRQDSEADVVYLPNWPSALAQAESDYWQRQLQIWMQPLVNTATQRMDDRQDCRRNEFEALYFCAPVIRSLRAAIEVAELVEEDRYRLFRYCLQIALRAIWEAQWREYLEHFPFTNLAAYLEAGHFPCGMKEFLRWRPLAPLFESDENDKPDIHSFNAEQFMAPSSLVLY